MRSFILVFCLLAINQFLFSQIKIGVITDDKETMESRQIIDALVQEIDRTTGVNLKVISD